MRTEDARRVPARERHCAYIVRPAAGIVATRRERPDRLPAVDRAVGVVIVRPDAKAIGRHSRIAADIGPRPVAENGPACAERIRYDMHRAELRISRVSSQLRRLYVTSAASEGDELT